MSDKSENPIPFNPATLSVSDALSCVEALSALFEMVERNCSDSDIANNVRAARDHMIRKAKRS